MSSSPIIVIAGCTGSGKSDIALKLAKEINGVIINADSRQIYKEISIGTAKPTPDKVENGVWYIDEVKHYLYSYVSVKENYNLYRYQQDVHKTLSLLKSNEIPILVGGTGLYIDSIVMNYQLKESQKNDEEDLLALENQSIEELQKLVGDKLLEKLNESDKHNPRRLIRIIKGGLPSVEKGKPMNHIYFVIDIKKEELEKRIVHRVDRMLQDGLIEENKEVRDAGLNKYPALNTIGYIEFNDYFSNKKTLEEVKSEIITHTKQYAKRQRTWFKRNSNALYVESYRDILSKTKKFLNDQLQ